MMNGVFTVFCYFVVFYLSWKLVGLVGASDVLSFIIFYGEEVCEQLMGGVARDEQ